MYVVHNVENRDFDASAMSAFVIKKLLSFQMIPSPFLHRYPNFVDPFIRTDFAHQYFPYLFVASVYEYFIMLFCWITENKDVGSSEAAFVWVGILRLF